VTSVYQTIESNNGLRFSSMAGISHQAWQGSLERIALAPEEIQAKLLDLEQPCYVVSVKGQIGVTNGGYLSPGGAIETLVALPSFFLQQLGDPNFQKFHGVKYAYATGAMGWYCFGGLGNCSG
jgi:trans-AT polyketide synthase, acyltransferase and oxidoreductase domains